MSATAPPAEAVVSLSPLGAVVGTFSRPSETIERLVRRPTWWRPFLATVLLTSALFVVSMPKLDWDRTVRDAMEKRAAVFG